MPAIKVKEWKGLYTNIDENDQPLNTARISINWRHSRGYLEFEPRELSEYALPIIDSALATYNWEWETGIYCTIVSDNLAQNPSPAKYDILLVVAKALDTDGITYHRLIYFKDITNNSGWYEPHKNGNLSGTMIENYDINYNFTNSYFDTIIDAEVFFRVESGHLKIFFPHDVFWLGRLERDMNIPGRKTYAINNFYLDKLVENYDYSMSPGTEMLPPQRIAWSGATKSVVASADTGAKEPITLGMDNDYVLEPYDDTGSGDYCRKYVWHGTMDSTKDQIPTTVAPEYSQTEIQSAFWGYFKYNDGRIAFPAEFWDFYEPFVPSTGEGRDLVSEGIATYSIDLDIAKFNADDTYKLPYSMTLAGRHNYMITPEDFNNIKWRYKYNASDGFLAAETGYHLVVTAVLDEREECVIYMQNKGFGDVTVGYEWALDVYNATVERWSNYRVTRLRYYLRLNSEEVHYLYKDVPFLPGDVEQQSQFYLWPRDNTGITMASNIGIEIEPDEMYRYKVITSFRDFTTELGVSIGLSYDDYVNVYYSVLGGGNLQPDLVYSQNILPVTGANIVNACAAINTKLVVLSNDSMYLIDVVTDLGALVFTMNKTLEFGVKNQFDVAPIQGGIAINTKHGIYTSTGTQSNLISEPIDDVVKTYFDTSRIYYNKDVHELYYKRNGSDDLYRFRFKDQVWEVINKY